MAGKHQDLVQESVGWAINRAAHSRWGAHHEAAFSEPRGGEVPIVDLISSAAHYADWYHEQYKLPIGKDRNLGPHWAAMIRSLLGLLQGDCGRLDSATLRLLLQQMLTEEGFDE